MISKDTLKELKRLRKTSGISGMRLLRSRGDVPEGLDSGYITGWLSGQIRYAETAHLDYILSIWPKADPLVKVTDTMVKQVNAEFQRTGVQVKSVSMQLSATDPKFGESGITRMRKGKRATIYQSTWNRLLEIFAQYPDKKEKKTKPRIVKPAKPKPGKKARYLSHFADDYAALSESQRAELAQHRDRTGVAATELLRRFAAKKPDKLSANTISAWINGEAKKASKSRLNWVLKMWRSLPDKSL